MTDESNKPSEAQWIIQVDSETWHLTPALRQRGGMIEQLVTKHPNDLRVVRWISLCSKPKVGLHFPGILDSLPGGISD